MKNIIEKVSQKLNIAGDFVYKYRYYLAIILLIICVVFELNGSSIGCWNQFLNTGVEKTNEIFGKSRRVRADEWATFTPMMFSQKFDGFHWFSNILGGGGTDVFLIYALPVLNLMQIFRPFQIGFLFLSLSKGLSFFWMSRLIFLFLISFDFGMLISNRKKLLALAYSFMVTFSPMIQWWFAINGSVEIILFGELAIVLLDKYLLDNNFKHRVAYLFGLIVSAGGYILVFYPAWQVPAFYVFLFVAIWVFIKDFKEIKISRKDIISISIALIVFILCMTYILVRSYDTLKTILNTVYPGGRVERGGKTIAPSYKWVSNIFLPYKDVLLKMDQSTSSAMFGLFPIGIILSIYNLIVNKNKDKLTICLLISYAILFGYSYIGFPEILAKITMLGRSTAYRAYFGTGFLDIVLLLRALSTNEKSVKLIPAIIISGIVSGILVYYAKMDEYVYITKKMLIAMIIMCTYLFFFVLRISSKYSKALFSIGVIFVVLMAGATVNPLRYGVTDITESPILQAVKRVNSEENGIWLVTDMPYPIPEYLVMAGVPLINSTNTYPFLERWKMFDEEGKYEDIYNRYAHIRIYIVSSEEEYINENGTYTNDKFEQTTNDSFKMYILPDELKKLNIKYVFSIADLENRDTENTKFERLDDVNGYKIYKVNYIN